ncbi:MAG: PAS domain-containing sensor histidine kinase [Desulfobacteraceae bacterium]|nr:MAG: PAS domain-containing sensor histidine kinase [Desulfobacteraceae bacterium]
MSEKPTYEQLEHKVRELEDQLDALKHHRPSGRIPGHPPTENELEAKNRLMNTLLDNLQVGIFMVEAPTGKPLLANKKAMELLGRGIMHDADRRTLADVYQAYKIGTGEIYPEEQLPIVRGLYGENHAIDDMVVIQPNGKKIFLEVFGSPVTDPEGNITASLISFSDITERKQFERQISDLADQWQSTFDAMNAVIWVLDKDNRIIRSNRLAETIFNRPMEQILGKYCWQVVHGTAEPIPECPISKSRISLKRESLELQLGQSWYDVTIDPLLNDKGEFHRSIHILTDITQRKLTEEKLRKNEEQYRLLVEHQTDLVVKVDLEGRFEFVSQSYCNTFGMDETRLLGSNFMPLVHPDDQAATAIAMEAIFKPPYSAYMEQRAKTVEGWRWIAWMDTAVFNEENDIVSIIGVGRDITDLKEMETELRHAHKMESIGTLAGGIAHDFNNILSIILGNAELAMDDTPDWSPVHANIDKIKSASLRAKDIVRQLLSFSRKTELEQVPLNIYQVIHESLKLIRASIPSHVDIELHDNGATFLALADATQIHQVIINLCTNAADAIVEPTGKIDIFVRNSEVVPESGGIRKGLSPGSYVELIIKDSGSGIDPAIQDKIFDPYFTTKAIGKGTGMGLSVVHGIIESHHGVIYADSTPDKGTAFYIFLPATPQPAAPAGEPAVTSGSTVTGTVLFVDDESAIVEMTREILVRLGYTVETETSPIRALEIFQRDPDRFDLVISDMTMPEMSGEVLIRKLKTLRPALPVILCTGFSTQMDEDRARHLGISAFAMKPLSMSKIAGLIKKVMGQETGDDRPLTNDDP